MTTQEKNAQKIIEILERAGYTALFAGGYVRDKIMGREVHDIDIATSASPEEVMRALDKAKVKHIEIGEQFGVVAAVIPLGKEDNQLVEIATFRQDLGVGDSRHPKNVKLKVTPEEDASRRDFTINGMFGVMKNAKIKDQNDNEKLDIENSLPQRGPELAEGKIENGKLKIIDYVGGIKDVESRIIRFIGDPDERIREDALRMIRAVRFSAQLGFEIEQKSWQAIEKNAQLITKISGERIRDELNKIMVADSTSHGFDLLERSGLLKYIIPEAEKAKTTDQPSNFHAEGNLWNHILLALKNMRKKDDPLFGWAVFFHDIAKSTTIMMPKDADDRIRFHGHDTEGAKMAEKVMRRLKFANDEIDKVSWLVKYHMLFGNFSKMRPARKILYLKHPFFGDLLELFWTDANSSLRTGKKGNILPPDLSAYNRAKSRYDEESNKQPLPERIVTGHDVMEVMGLTSGSKKVGEVMEEAYNLQLEGKIRNKKEGLAVIKKLLKK